MLHANRDIRTNPFGPCVESCVVGERGVVFVHVNKITDLKKNASIILGFFPETLKGKIPLRHHVEFDLFAVRNAVGKKRIASVDADCFVPLGPLVDLPRGNQLLFHVSKITYSRLNATLFLLFIVWRNYAMRFSIDLFRLFALGGNR